MLDHAVNMCRMQMDGGKGFIFENPLSASSWHQESLRLLMADARAWAVEVHMCAYGLRAVDEQGEALVSMPTRLPTNIEPVAKSLKGRCSGYHRHAHLVCGKAHAAAAYSQNFRTAILKGNCIWKHDRQGREHAEQRRGRYEQYHDLQGVAEDQDA